MQYRAAGDFLKKGISIPIVGRHLAAGAILSIASNCESVLQAAQESFGQAVPESEGRDDIRLRLWVDHSCRTAQKRVRPYFRGLGHLIFAGFDDQSSLLINLHDRSCLGRFAPSLASDVKLWRAVVFPMLLTVVGPSVGLVPLHCACVAREGSGLLLAGESGSGKSSLSLALAQAGFDYLSDDRTLVSLYRGRTLAWGLFPEMKQRADATAYFPALREITAGGASNEGEVVRFIPADALGLNQVECCEPRWIIFLERHSEPTFALRKIAPEEAIRRFEKGLHRQTPEILNLERGTIGALVTNECYVLRYGGNPHTVAGAIRSLIVDSRKLTTVSAPAAPSQDSETECPDPLRRFRSTPLQADLLLMGRRIRLETESPIVMDNAVGALNGQGPAEGVQPDFLWRIVTERREQAAPVWAHFSAFSNQDVRYINFGQHSFVAVDLKTRIAVGVLPEHLARDADGFSSVFLASMYYLTAPALGLTAISAACVSRGGKGILLLGPPRSGKTTVSYWATKLDLDFHADQAVFLEAEDRRLRAWGDFWPAAFRPETTRYFPELAASTRPFHLEDRMFLCMDKLPVPNPGRSVTPAACAFLERSSGGPPRLVPVPAREGANDYAPAAPFWDDAGSGPERDAVFASLGRLPAFRILYGKDPSVVAFFLRSILNSQALMEEYP